MAGFADIELTPALARAVVRGDREAVAGAYQLLVQAVMNLSARILQDRQLAEEVVQDTFVELLEKSKQIKDYRAVIPWVRRVAVNLCLMRLRSPWQARRDALEPEQLDAVAGSDDGGVEWAGNTSAVGRALGQLSGDARAVLWLHDVEGYTHKEIGELMGKTTSFSKSQLARAYERLVQWQESRIPDGVRSAQPKKLQRKETGHEKPAILH